MRKILWSAVVVMAVLAMSQTVMAAKIIDNQVSMSKLKKMKSFLDDPTPFFEVIENGKALMSAEGWNEALIDVDAAKEQWAEIVGFKAPDVVGKIAPEIKPGKYTIADKDKYAFDKLMPKVIYDRFSKPSEKGKKHGGNFTEFEIVPTRQYFQHPGVSKATKAGRGKSKLDADGYLDYATYEGGYPFAAPSGDQKADQIVYNALIEYQHYPEEYAQQVATWGFDKKLNIDFRGAAKWYFMRLGRRVKQAPLGWYDSRTEKKGEKYSYLYIATAPRDLYGNAYLNTKYYSPDKMNNLLLYATFTRRVRKMSSADTQDQAVGTDIAFDDAVMGFDQKYIPNIYPYEVTLLEEREFLLPAYSWDGAEYLDTKSGDMLWQNLKLERRPMYVIEMKQKDPTYIYSKRICYIDKETNIMILQEMYDQKGRLYRSENILHGFWPETATYSYWQAWMRDHLDTHSTFDVGWQWLTEGMKRSAFTPKTLSRLVK